MMTKPRVANVDPNGATTIVMAAETGADSTVMDNPTSAVPFPANALENRRELLIAFPTDSFVLGGSGTTTTTGYGVRGSGRASGWSGPSNRAQSGNYSNRKQFLRGQYVALEVSDSLDIYGLVATGIEQAVAFELA